MVCTTRYKYPLRFGLYIQNLEKILTKTTNFINQAWQKLKHNLSQHVSGYRASILLNFQNFF